MTIVSNLALQPDTTINHFVDLHKPTVFGYNQPYPAWKSTSLLGEPIWWGRPQHACPAGVRFFVGQIKAPLRHLTHETSQWLSPTVADILRMMTCFLWCFAAIWLADVTRQPSRAS